MKALTIRNVDARLAKALERERARRGRSLNQTVLEVLRQSLGVGSDGPRSNGLRELAGSWSATDKAEFDAAVRVFEEIDAELWR